MIAMSNGQNFFNTPSAGNGNPSCNLRNPTINKNQLKENKDTATNWSFGVVPGKARGIADEIRKKGAHAVV